MGAKVLGDEGDLDATPEALLAAKAWILKYGVLYSVFLCIAWPLAFLPMGVFGKSTFQIWAGIALMWGWIGGVSIIAWPLIESFEGTMSIFSKKGATAGAKQETAVA